jgi:ribosomal protein S18 acetylase RimI-like enzyme
VQLRRAHPDDALAFVRVKTALPMPQRLQTTQGGFLLGTSLEQYRAFIERDLVWVLEDAGHIVGFAIVLGWDSLRHSELWLKRDEVKLETATAIVFPERPAYFEQLAVLPEARGSAWYLAYRATCEALRDHDGMLTTTVRQPVTNTAALPYLRVAGFQRVGEILETYPEVGQIVSDVHYLPKQVFLERTRNALFVKGLTRAERQGVELDATPWRDESRAGINPPPP